MRKCSGLEPCTLLAEEEEEEEDFLGYWKNDYFYFQAFVVYVSHTVNVLVTDVILNIKIPEQLKFTYFI